MIASIPTLIAIAFVAMAFILRSCGIAVAPVDPISAGAIAAIAGMLGAAVPLRNRGSAVDSLYSGLLGTVVHMLSCIALTVAAVATHKVNGKGPFLFWLFGGYWISLLTLVWLARRIVVAKAIEARN